MRLIGVLLALSPIAHAAEPAIPGRLFHTPEERRALDDERAADEKPGRKSGQTTVNGVLIRSSGDATVWINQQMQHQDKDAPAKPSGRIRTPDGKSLRVGETSSRSGVEDLLEPGAIRVGPSP